MRPRAIPPHAPHGGARRAYPYEITRNSILRISDAKTIQLIQEWEKQECLWNTNLEDYPNKGERLIATGVIAKKLDLPNFSQEHVAMKFKNLRNSYCQELKKMAADEKYRPKVFWFQHNMDKFLRPHLQKISSYLGNSKVVSQVKPVYDIKTEIDSDEESDDWNVENVTRSEASCSSSVQIDPIFTEQSTSENGEITNQPDVRKRKLSEESLKRNEFLLTFSENGHPLDQDQDKNGENVNTIQKKTSEKELVSKAELRKRDCYDSFGIYVASLLRTLPPKKALMLQPKIVDLIVSVSVEEVTDTETAQ